jgi:hypothetical protein
VRQEGEFEVGAPEERPHDAESHRISAAVSTGARDLLVLVSVQRVGLSNRHCARPDLALPPSVSP